MRLINNVSNDAIQRHTIPLSGNNITLTVRFYSVTQIWTMDAEWNGESVFGVKMSLGVNHFLFKNWPFDFIVTDGSTAGIDPFQVDDFISGRCQLYFLEPSDVEQIRGYSVQI